MWWCWRRNTARALTPFKEAASMSRIPRKHCYIYLFQNLVSSTKAHRSSPHMLLPRYAPERASPTPVRYITKVREDEWEVMILATNAPQPYDVQATESYPRSFKTRGRLRCSEQCYMEWQARHGHTKGVIMKGSVFYIDFCFRSFILLPFNTHWFM